MDTATAAATAAAARLCHRRIEARRRRRCRHRIEQALKSVWQQNADASAEAALAKERACAEMRSHRYVAAALEAALAAAAEPEPEPEKWGEPSAEAVAAADARVFGSELTDMVNFVAGNDAPALLRWMATNDASQLPAGWTVLPTPQ